MNPSRINIEQALDVALCFAGNSDDRIRHFQRGFLYPKRKIVAAGELFALPRPKRFQRMDCYDKGDAVILFGQNPAKVSVPRMTMHQVGIDVSGVEIDASPHCTESGAQWFWAGEIARVEFEANDLELAFFKMLVAKAAHFHWHRLCQLAREITPVHPRPAIDVRRVLICEEKNLHPRFRSL